MNATVADVIRIMETIAPPHHAEEWDNVGLQVGDTHWTVKKIWVALDPTLEVVANACTQKVDLLITHHPFLFNALKMIDFGTPLGKCIRLAARHKMAIFSAHTNLDNAPHGINDTLAEKIGLTNITVLKESTPRASYKLVVTVPINDKEKIIDALTDVSVRRTDSIAHDSFTYFEHGAFVQGKRILSPKGRAHATTSSGNIRIETTIHDANVPKAIYILNKMCPLEEPFYDIYPLMETASGGGSGRTGDLNEPMSLSSFADHLCSTFGASCVKVTGDPDLCVDRVAVCSGSGSGLINDFLSSGAQVFVSGDLRYHDARRVEDNGLAMVDIGHFVSEFIVVETLRARLKKIFREKKIGVRVDACRIERDPFWFIKGSV